MATRKKNDRAPNWDKWRSAQTVRLWQGVALSLNIEPETVQIELRDGKHPANEEFNNRLFAAQQNHGSLKVTALSLSDAHEHSVTMRSFVACARLSGWAIPSELAALLSKPAAKWSTRALWTVMETAHLFADREPDPTANPSALSGAVHDWYRDLKDAVTLKQIPVSPGRSQGIGNNLLKPSDAVTWALDTARTIPQQFADIAPPQPSRAELQARIAELEAQAAESWKLEDAGPHYPRELDIAFQAWRAVSNDATPTGTARQRLERRIKQAHPNLKPEQVKRIAIVANWDKGPGAKPKKSK